MGNTRPVVAELQGIAVPDDAFAITPGTALTSPVRKIYVGTTGNLVVTTAAGNEATFNNVPAGFELVLNVTAVSSDSTASDLVGVV